MDQQKIVPVLNEVKERDRPSTDPLDLSASGHPKVIKPKVLSTPAPQGEGGTFDLGQHVEPVSLFRGSSSMDNLLSAVNAVATPIKGGPVFKPPTSQDALDNTTHSKIRDVIEVCTQPKYAYRLAVDPDQDDRATEINLFSCARPHMRSFWASTICFFAAFCSWFAIPPLMPTIAKSLKMTPYQIYQSNIIALLATIFARFICGPLSARYGARKVMAWVLILGSIPTFLVGTVTTFEGLCTVRFFIGIIGSSFVMCQYWSNAMFAKNIVGSANAIAGGWGNLGGGITQMFMGSAVYPLFQLCGSNEIAWRGCFVVPAFLTVCCGVWTFYCSDDTPKGNLSELKTKESIVGQLIGHEDTDKENNGSFKDMLYDFFQAIKNPNVVLLMINYACTFGVELQIDNIAANYYYTLFKVDQSTAALAASSFGLCNVFARAMGGILSDLVAKKFGMRGRLALQLFVMLGTGCLILGFAKQTPANGASLANSVGMMIIFSIFAEAGCGTTFGITPFVDPKNTGAVYGAVGAGGNIGACLWGVLFLWPGALSRPLPRRAR